MTATPPTMHTTLVTIPDCTATHIIGSSTLPLASGTLTLLKSARAPANHPSVHSEEQPDSQPQKSPDTNHPPLTIQLGPLAFPLAKDTLFGTDATSSRAYMFVPKMEGISGYVRLELPEWAGEPGSSERNNDANPDGRTNNLLEPLEPLSTAQSSGVSNHSLQDSFEQALIAEGLLKEGWEAVRDEIGRGVMGAVDGIRDKVVEGLSTEKGRVPPEALEEDKE